MGWAWEGRKGQKQKGKEGEPKVWKDKKIRGWGANGF